MARENEIQVQQDGHLGQGTSLEVAPQLHLRTYLVPLALFMINVAQVIQLTAAGSFAATIASVVGGEEKASWIISAVLISMPVFGVSVSQASDYWGRKNFLVGLNAMGFVGCLITSRATSIGMVIAGQAITGLAFVSVPLAFAVMSEVLPHRHRMTGAAVASAGNGFGGIIALLAGNALVEAYGPEGYRYLWYIDAAIFGIATFICALCYRPPLRELQSALTTKQKLKSLDWIGIFLVAAALLPILIGFSWAESPYPWHSAHVIVPICISGLLMILFGLYEWKFKTDGILNHRLFERDRNVALALVGIFVEGYSFMGPNNFLPFEAGTLFLPKGILVGTNYAVAYITYMITAFLAAAYCYRYKRLRTVLIVGFSFLLIFSASMSGLNLGDRQAIWGLPVIFGIGWGTSMNALVSIAQFSAPPELIATTSGLMAGSRGLGAAAATAVYTAVFSSSIGPQLAKNIGAAVLPLGLPDSSLPSMIQDLGAGDEADLQKVNGITPEIIAAGTHGFKLAYLASFKNVWIIAVAISAAILLMAFFFKECKEDFNMKIDAPAEGEDALFGKSKASEEEAAV